MARGKRISFKNQSEYFLKLNQLSTHFEKKLVIEKAVDAGAAIVADQIRRNLEALPEDAFRYLLNGEKFDVASEQVKADLGASFGLTPIDRDRQGFVHTKAGMDGYGSYPTRKYPEGVPNALIARSIESGSSVRQKHPFVEPAIKITRKQAIAAMEKSIDAQLEEYFGGK